ncbi:uncharacterized protein LOC106647256 [Copidosoma floridanum]|uniref:uncharacterized protein LOC106647256 n=1 Tax=Copidosoma floridanum TaxID=29053 RepID=UPI0006C9882C|nr:uncharacterized protein LOC106647256 [Copidosoma floridanum]
MKLLGVTLDSNLTFRPHTIEVAKRCFSALARLRRNAYFLPVKTKLMLVKSLVFSILEYCPALQLGLSSELKTKLSRCMNAALRFVVGIKKSDHISPTYRRFKLLAYDVRIKYLTLRFLSTMLKSRQPAYLANYLKFKIPERTGVRTSPLDLNVPSARIDFYIAAFRVGALKLWNKLPTGIQACFARPCFGSKLYELLLDRPNYLD